MTSAAYGTYRQTLPTYVPADNEAIPLLVDQYGRVLTSTSGNTSGQNGVASSPSGMQNVLPELEYRMTPRIMADGQFRNALANSQGAMLVDSGISSFDVSVQAAITGISTTNNGTLINGPSNAGYRSVVNRAATGGGTIYLAFGFQPQTSDIPRLFPLVPGAIFTMENNRLYKGAIYGICTVSADASYFELA